MFIEVIEWYFGILMALFAIYVIEFAIERVRAWRRGEGVHDGNQELGEDDYGQAA